MKLIRYFMAAVGIAGIAMLLAQAQVLVPATKENESKFFRAFDPKPLVNKAGLGCDPHGRPAEQVTQDANGETNGAGTAMDDVHHAREIEVWFCEDAVKNAALMAAIDHGVLTGLQNAGCVMGEHVLTTRDGLRVTYRCGDRTKGSLTVKIKPSDAPEIDVESSLQFRIEETYAVGR